MIRILKDTIERWTDGVERRLFYCGAGKRVRCGKVKLEIVLGFTPEVWPYLHVRVRKFCEKCSRDG